MRARWPIGKQIADNGAKRVAIRVTGQAKKEAICHFRNNSKTGKPTLRKQPAMVRTNFSGGQTHV